ncbi:acyl carrier protein [Nocardia sp. NBC_00511]|uniref:acyl carrier protein n=1 Tax=Nocardia sp. NBC_00511 TaxID=2903591 RepID=UPI0030E3B8D4
MFSYEMLADLIEELLDVDADQLTPHTVLSDLAHWDSVDQLRFLVRLERRLTVPVDFDEFMAAMTPAELLVVVRSALPSPRAQAG